MNNALKDLQELGLSLDEAAIYLELLQGPRSHLKLSHITGINRTKVYRIVEALQQKSLVSKRVDDRGSFLVASDPTSLEVALIADEEKVKQRRQTLGRVVPALTHLNGKDQRDFIIRTYDGVAGLKQMCWHELRAKRELLALGNGTIEQIVSNDAWASEHRKRQISAGYKTREIINYNYTTMELPELASQELMSSKLYEYRHISPTVFAMDAQTTIYNNTVAIYHWKQDKKVGIEIISMSYATMMRQIFEHYWVLAAEK